MRTIRDAIAWLRVGKSSASSLVEPIVITNGRSSVVMGTTASGKGADRASISESDKIAQASQALFVAHELLVGPTYPLVDRRNRQSRT